MSNVNRTSRFLSLLLRHHPEDIGITLDSNGWTSVSELIKKMKNRKMEIDLDILKEIVETNDKKRFSFNDNFTKIRANQGHSLAIDLQLKPTKPLDYLFHGTVYRHIQSIKREGLKKMKRNHVHLCPDLETAKKVGSRRGEPVILKIRAVDMHLDGHKFFLSDNGVWLCDNVPPEYISF